MEYDAGCSLAILDSLSETSIPTRRLRASHALLYSAALYKNFIDVASDSIIVAFVLIAMYMPMFKLGMDLV